MKRLSAQIAGMIVLIVATDLPVEAGPVDFVIFRGDTWAAIAYSEQTGKYGYAYDRPSRDIAEIVARRYCEAKDAKVVTWVHNGWCALALGDDGAWGAGFSSGKGASNTAAKRDALKECKKHSKIARLVICVCSVNRRPEKFE